MANISSYNQLSNWNEDDDLLFVQQPDAPKKAHPSQLKQYVEAGDFEATGEIIDGHGNILAKKADQTTITIPVFTPSQAGWRRICKIKPTSGNTINGIIHVGGNYSSGQPVSASVAVNTMYVYASLTLLSNAIGNDARITAMRLVRSTVAYESEYWLDLYFSVFNSGTGPHRLIFTGDIAVSDIQNPISITTDATAATTEISLNQNVSGTVLTDKSVSGVITLNSGWNFDTQHGACTLEKQGNIAWLSSYIYNSNDLVPDTAYEIGTLPAGFIPSKEIKLPMYQGTSLSSIRGILNIKATGKIDYRSVDGSRYAIYTTIMYPLN